MEALKRPPVVLDVTRLFTRRGRGPDTGIDRVERGYFEYFAYGDENRFMIRNGRFYTLHRAEAIRELLTLTAEHKRERFFQIAKRASKFDLTSIDLGPIKEFIHVGHISHEASFWHRLKKAGVRISVLIHDVVPLDYPEYCVPELATRFQKSFRNWTNYADDIITPSHYSASRIRAHAPIVGEIKIVPLAITNAPNCDKSEEGSSFVIIGTIEPRKNLMTIFRAWEMLAARNRESTPQLHIIGRRGWQSEEVFRFLDSSPMMGKFIFEHGGLDDQAMHKHFCAAQALIFPSFVEGFGLPIYEAARARKKVIASDIPAFREACPDLEGRLVAPLDAAGWANAVLEGGHAPGCEPLGSWAEHIGRALPRHVARGPAALSA